jgi:hypothetical protein
MAANNRIELVGLQAFKAALRNLPDELVQEGNDIVREASTRAASDVQNSYPEGPTGNLRRGVTREEDHSSFGVSIVVKSRAKHAWIFENGTGQRTTRNGSNRGRMPAASRDQRMIPVVIRYRRAMTEKLKALVRKAGFQVE